MTIFKSKVKLTKHALIRNANMAINENAKTVRQWPHPVRAIVAGL